MRVLVISDTQFDSYDRLSTVRDDGITSRLADVLAAFDWAVDAGVKSGCDVLALTGDIFNNRTAIGLPILDRVCRCVYAASKRFDRTFVIAGNHDSYLRSADINALQSFRGFADIIDSAPLVYDTLAFLPWNDDPAQLSQWIDHDILPLRQAKYLFGHALVKGAVPGDKGLDPAVLRAPKFKRVILGDVHEPLVIKPNIHYVGALLQLHFGDCNGKRGFQILDTTKDVLTHVPNTISPRFHLIKDEVVRADVKPSDFVRIESFDAKRADVAVAKAQALGAWVESTAPPAEAEIAVRVDVRTSHDDDKILRAYLDYNKMTDPVLFDMGMAIMQEARQ